MVDDSLKGPYDPKQARLSIVETGELETQGEANAVDRDGFEGVIVESAVGKWHVDVVVH